MASGGARLTRAGSGRTVSGTLKQKKITSHDDTVGCLFARCRVVSVPTNPPLEKRHATNRGDMYFSNDHQASS